MVDWGGAVAGADLHCEQGVACAADAALWLTRFSYWAADGFQEACRVLLIFTDWADG